MKVGLQLHRLGQVRQVLAGRAQGLQRFAVAALAQIELAQRPDRLQLEGAAVGYDGVPVLDLPANPPTPEIPALE